MIVVCKPDLAREDFDRIERLVDAGAFDLRWGRRAGRLVLLFEPAHGSEALIDQLVADPAVDYALRNPTPAEIARIISRRDLLDLALAGTGFMAAAAVLGPLGLYLAAPSDARPTSREQLVGRADAIPVGGAHHRVLEGEEYIVVRRDEKRFYMLAATCPHSQVCLVEWDPERSQLVCPCHRGVFDLEGNVISGPPPRPLPRREVVVRNGELFMRRPTG